MDINKADAVTMGMRYDVVAVAMYPHTVRSETPNAVQISGAVNPLSRISTTRTGFLFKVPLARPLYLPRNSRASLS